MKSKTSLLFCAILFAIVSCQPDSANKSGNSKETASYKGSNAKLIADRICIPGKKVGAINTTTTEVILIAIYGAENVSRDSLHVGEGFFIPGTKLFTDTPDELRIAWKPDSLFKKIARIIIETPNTRWKTQNGISIGTPISKVVEINEVDFDIFGFDWDYSGSVSNWNAGTLENSGLGMRFAYNTDPSTLSIEDFGQVIGDQGSFNRHRSLTKNGC